MATRTGALDSPPNLVGYAVSHCVINELSASAAHVVRPLQKEKDVE